MIFIIVQYFSNICSITPVDLALPLRLSFVINARPLNSVYKAATPWLVLKANLGEYLPCVR